MNIGLYFGSFNPIHHGHLIIANHILQNTNLDKIWFVVSPQNPLKNKGSLLNEYDRLYLVQLAIENNSGFRASNIEFHLPKPSYTANTLAYMVEKFPREKFTIIMGSDSYQNLERWKNHKQIIENFKILIYVRPEFPVDPATLPSTISIVKAPLLEISSSYIRDLIKQKRSIQYLVPEKVAKYIEENGYYLR